MGVATRQRSSCPIFPGPEAQGRKNPAFIQHHKLWLYDTYTNNRFFFFRGFANKDAEVRPTNHRMPPWKLQGYKSASLGDQIPSVMANLTGGPGQRG